MKRRTSCSVLHGIGLCLLLLAAPAFAARRCCAIPSTPRVRRRCPGADGWNQPLPGYDLSRLTARTEALLAPDTPVVARMETLRRAAICASRDGHVARQLVAALDARVDRAFRRRREGAGAVRCRLPARDLRGRGAVAGLRHAAFRPRRCGGAACVASRARTAACASRVRWHCARTMPRCISARRWRRGPTAVAPMPSHAAGATRRGGRIACWPATSRCSAADRALATPVRAKVPRTGIGACVAGPGCAQWRPRPSPTTRHVQHRPPPCPRPRLLRAGLPAARSDPRTRAGRAGLEIAKGEYIDLSAGIAVCGLATTIPTLVAALTEQAGKLWHTSNVFYSEPPLRLAEELVAASRFARRVFLCNSGAEANEAAIKLVRKGRRRRDARRTGASSSPSAAASTAARWRRSPRPRSRSTRKATNSLPGGFRHVDFNDATALEIAMAAGDVATRYCSNRCRARAG